MSKVIVLGGSGAVGSVAVKTLAACEDITEIILGDLNLAKAEEVRQAANPAKISVRQVDASDTASVKAAITGCDAVLNCTGPFYKLLPPTLRAVLEAGINYVDVCDDVDVTREILGWDEKAKKAGVTVLLGMGSSPGVTNLLAAFAARTLLEETDSIDLYHIHGGEPFEGAGVIEHRFHCMAIDVPMFLDGAFKEVKFFEPEGVALQEEVDFRLLGKYRVYPYPHPETITLPTFLPGVKRVTNKGTILPTPYYDLTMTLARLGLTGKEPLTVKGQQVSPYDFSVSFLLRERDRILKETAFGKQRGCVKIVVTGRIGGKSHTIVFSLASQGQALGEGTGIPAAMGTLLMLRGKIEGKGILPPEACVNPLDFMALMQEVLGLGDGSGKQSPLTIESIDEHGNVQEIQF